MQYGPYGRRAQAAVAYLGHYQLVPWARLVELLKKPDERWIGLGTLAAAPARRSFSLDAAV